MDSEQQEPSSQISLDSLVELSERLKQLKIYDSLSARLLSQFLQNAEQIRKTLEEPLAADLLRRSKGFIITWSEDAADAKKTAKELLHLVRSTLSSVLAYDKLPEVKREELIAIVDYWDLRNQITLSRAAQENVASLAEASVATAIDARLPDAIRQGTEAAIERARKWRRHSAVVSSLVLGVGVIVVALLFIFAKGDVSASERAVEKLDEQIVDIIARRDEATDELRKQISSLREQLGEAKLLQEELQKTVKRIQDAKRDADGNLQSHLDGVLDSIRRDRKLSAADKQRAREIVLSLQKEIASLAALQAEQSSSISYLQEREKKLTDKMKEKVKQADYDRVVPPLVAKVDALDKSLELREKGLEVSLKDRPIKVEIVKLIDEKIRATLAGLKRDVSAREESGSSGGDPSNDPGQHGAEEPGGG